jgi:hypothetical protein
MKRILLLCVIIFPICIGCGTVPKSYEEVFIPSETNESKMCRMECKKVLLMQLQADEEEYQSDVMKKGRSQADNLDTRLLNSSLHESEYEECVQDCGGTFETIEKKR